MSLRFCAWIDDLRDLREVSSSGNHIRWMLGSPGCGQSLAGGVWHWPNLRRTPRCECALWSSQWSCLVATTDGATGLRLLSCRDPGPVTLKKHQHQWPQTQMAAVVVVLHRQMSRYQYLSQSLGAWAGQAASCSPQTPPCHCSLGLCHSPRPSCRPCPGSCTRSRRSWSARACYCSGHWTQGRGLCHCHWQSCESCLG